MEATTSPHFIVLNELVGNHPATLNAMQSLLAPHVQLITIAWLAIWCTTGIFALRHLVREIMRQHHNQS